MYKVTYSKQFKKSLKRLEKSGKKADILKLKEVVVILSNESVLGKNYRDHNLHGGLSNLRECHIKANLLLIYKKDMKQKVLVLVDIGGHDLF